MAASREEVFERVKEVLSRAARRRRERDQRRGVLPGGPRGGLTRPRRADHGARGPIRDQDLRRGRAEDPDRWSGRRLRLLAPVTQPSELALIEELPAERLENVFTHSSWAPDRVVVRAARVPRRQRLELAVARELYERYPDFTEGRSRRSAPTSSRGELRRRRARARPRRGWLERAAVVPHDELDEARRQPERARGPARGRARRALPRARFEPIEPSVVAAFAGRSSTRRRPRRPQDRAPGGARARGRQVTYSVLEADGPAHDRPFTCAALIDGAQAGVGSGRTKKDAEQEARARGARDVRVELSGHPPAVSLPRRAPACDQAARLQVVPGPGRGPARAGRCRRRRAERLRQVERRRRAALGRGEPRAERAARREARRRALRRIGQAGRRPTTARSSCSSTTRTARLPSFDFAEVSIARRLHRGGEGQYLVNGAPVRRTDVVELLADVGLGGRMGSIIGQGRVEEILGSKPRSGAQLVEEAAGLGRFKRRRHRAELKLARVATQVERARDVEAEVEKRLRPLALQATAAERAEKLGGEIARLRARIAQLDLATFDERAAGGERRAGGQRARTDRRRARGAARGARPRRGRARDAAGRPRGRPRRSTGCAARPSGSSCAARAPRPCASGCAPTPPPVRSAERERLLEQARLGRERLSALERTLAELRRTAARRARARRAGQPLASRSLEVEPGTSGGAAARRLARRGASARRRRQRRSSCSSRRARRVSATSVSSSAARRRTRRVVAKERAARGVGLVGHARRVRATTRSAASSGSRARRPRPCCSSSRPRRRARWRRSSELDARRRAASSGARADRAARELPSALRRPSRGALKVATRFEPPPRCARRRERQRARELGEELRELGAKEAEIRREAARRASARRRSTSSSRASRPRRGAHGGIEEAGAEPAEGDDREELGVKLERLSAGARRSAASTRSRRRSTTARRSGSPSSATSAPTSRRASRSSRTPRRADRDGRTPLRGDVRAPSANFAEVASTLFPGGEGRLCLTEPDPRARTRTRAGHRDRAPARRQERHPALAALGRREGARRDLVPLRALPRASVPVLPPRRGRGRARRHEHRPLRGPAAPLLRQAQFIVVTTRSGRWRPRTCLRRHHGRRRRFAGRLAPAAARSRRRVASPRMTTWSALLGDEERVRRNRRREPGFFGRLRDSLGKSRRALTGQLAAAAFDPADDEAWERLEEALIAADVGVPGHGGARPAARGARRRR